MRTSGHPISLPLAEAGPRVDGNYLLEIRAVLKPGQLQNAGFRWIGVWGS